MSETEREKNISRLNDLLKNFNVAMLTTLQSRDGSLHSRPMIARQEVVQGSLWFFSKFASGKVDEIRSGSQVNLSYQNVNAGRYISISGAAYILRDPAQLEAMWNDSYRTWFPQGLAEPELALIRIDVSEAEIWDGNDQHQAERLVFTR